jgi:hypothetical protein
MHRAKGLEFDFVVVIAPKELTAIQTSRALELSRLTTDAAINSCGLFGPKECSRS